MMQTRTALLKSRWSKAFLWLNLLTVQSIMNRRNRLMTEEGDFLG